MKENCYFFKTGINVFFFLFLKIYILFILPPCVYVENKEQLLGVCSFSHHMGPRN